MNKLSVCLITKDEEANIARALKSVVDVAGEMVVVDTGSTDATVEIAESLGARVFHHEWQHDFSEARNFALSCAANDWVLQLDADEELDEPRPAQIARLIAEPGIDSYFCHLVNLVRPDTLKGAASHRCVRLFRREIYEYKGILHECPEPRESKEANPAGWSGLRILHWGHLDSEKNLKRRRRNTDLLEQAVAKNPEDFMYRYYLGKDLMGRGKYSEAARELNQAESLRPAHNHAHQAEILLRLCESLGCAGQVSEAVQCVDSAASKFPDFRDIIYMAGEVQAMATNWEQALIYFRRCMKMTKVPSKHLLVQEGLDGVARQRAKFCEARLAESAD